MCLIKSTQILFVGLRITKSKTNPPLNDILRSQTLSVTRLSLVYTILLHSIMS